MTEFTRRNTYGTAPDRFADIVAIEGSHKTLYLSGMTGLTRDANGDFEESSFEEQTVLTYERIKELLRSEGASMADIVKTVAYVKQPGLRDVYMSIRKAALDGAPFAAHTYLVISDFAVPEVLVEVDVIAVVAQEA